eukprot:CAMPEP_0115145288 /NCGR_PEP_ID=MMETSP0227-20121206/62024_1 /TAXON_ID=89957 /ORGANISM="Polarella glacialis, Strain CCMP 1383" /LENGTH=102 /DNA_ID=CAMNT_0002554773 /DNA_START=564 /DNA_END=869 /DNA_ORIENTATION=+
MAGSEGNTSPVASIVCSAVRGKKDSPAFSPKSPARNSAARAVADSVSAARRAGPAATQEAAGTRHSSTSNKLPQAAATAAALGHRGRCLPAALRRPRAAMAL